MTRLNPFGRHSQQQASHQRPRHHSLRSWHKPEPPDLRGGLIVLGLGMVLGLGYLLQAISGHAGEAVFVLLFACALFLLGGLLLLVAIGQHVASRFSGMKKRCGCCRFFEVPSGLYVVGRCQADPSRSLVSRFDVCPSFFFSERALARDRLGQQPGVLKQLQIRYTSDAANKS